MSEQKSDYALLAEAIMEDKLEEPPQSDENTTDLCPSCGQLVPMELGGVRVGDRIRLTNGVFTFKQGNEGEVHHFFLKEGFNRPFIVEMGGDVKLMLRRDEFEVLGKPPTVEEMEVRMRLLGHGLGGMR